MKKFKNKISLKFLITILCLFLLIAGIMVFSTIRSVKIGDVVDRVDLSIPSFNYL
jgi:hypothetical protein